MNDGSIVDVLFSLWGHVGVLTKVGVISQAATWGLLAAAIRRPTRPVVAAALVTCTLGFIGLSLASVGADEYSICGAQERPVWCETWTWVR